MNESQKLRGMIAPMNDSAEENIFADGNSDSERIGLLEAINSESNPAKRKQLQIAYNDAFNGEPAIYPTGARQPAMSQPKDDWLGRLVESSENVYQNYKAAPQVNDDGDFTRSLRNYLPQTKEIAGNALAIVGLSAKKTFGEGEFSNLLISTGLEMANEAKTRQVSKDTDSFSNAYEKGIATVLTDWLPYQAGQTVGNLAESITAAVVGAGIGSVAGGGVASPATATGGAVAGFIGKAILKKEIKEKAEKMLLEEGEDATKKYLKKEIGKVIGLNAGIGGMATLHGFGETGGRAIDEAQKNGGTIDDVDVKKVFPAALAHAGAEFFGDKIALNGFLGENAYRAVGNGVLPFAKTLAGNVAKVGVKEAPVEVFQTGAERFGAGLPLTGEDAKRDYIDSAAAAAAMGMTGIGGGVRSYLAAENNIKSDITRQPSMDAAIKAAESSLDLPVLQRDAMQGGFDVSEISNRNQSDINEFEELLRAEQDDIDMRRGQFAQQGMARQQQIDELESLIRDETQDVQTRRDALLALQAQKREALNNAFTSDTLALPSPNDPTGVLRVGNDGVAVPETREQRVQAERARLRAMYRPKGTVDEKGVNNGLQIEQPSEVVTQAGQARRDQPETGLSTALAQPRADIAAAGNLPDTGSAGTAVRAEKANPVENPTVQASNQVAQESAHVTKARSLAGEFEKNRIDYLNHPKNRGTFITKLKRAASSIPLSDEKAVTILDMLATKLDLNKNGIPDTLTFAEQNKQPATLPQESSAPGAVIQQQPVQQPGAVAAPIILRKNGEPFTEAEAKLALKARKLDKTHNVVKVEGGFGLQEKPKRSPRKTLSPLIVDPYKHTLLQAIAIKGVNPKDKQANDLRRTLGMEDGANQQISIPGRLPMWLFRKNGMFLDDIAGDLSQFGVQYLDAHDLQEMMDKLYDDPDYMTPEGREMQAEREYAEQQAEQRATPKKKLDAAIAGAVDNETTIAELEWIIEHGGTIMSQEEADQFASDYAAYLENEYDQQRAAEAAASDDAGGQEGHSFASSQANQREAGQGKDDEFAIAGQTEAEIKAAEQAAHDAELAAIKAERDAATQRAKEAEAKLKADNAINGNAADAFSLTAQEPISKSKQKAIDKKKAESELVGHADLLSTPNTSAEATIPDNVSPTSENSDTSQSKKTEILKAQASGAITGDQAVALEKLADAGEDAAMDAVLNSGKAGGVYTIAAYNDVMDRAMSGDITADEFKNSFDALLNNQSGITSELEAMTKPQIFKQFPGLEYRYKNEKKADVVRAAYRDMISSYALGESFSYGMSSGSMEDSIRAMVDKTTDESLAEFADGVKKRREERAAQRAEALAGMDNPETLDDFNRLMSAKAQEIGEGATFGQARMALTPEQRAKFDELAANKSRTERASRKATQQEQTLRAPGEALTSSEIIKTRHTKHGHDLWQFNLDQRVSSEEFKLLVAQAKRLGGDYSSYRGNGAIPGWQFRTEEAAKAFKALLAGNTADAKDVMQARRDAYADDRSQTATERLNEMADSLEEKADASLSKERKANTARRARFAASAEAAANSDKAMAQTMRNIARGILNGTVKMLDKVRQKVQVEMLQGMVRTAQSDMLNKLYPSYAERESHNGEKPTAEVADYATYPSYTAYRSDLASIGRSLLETEGTMKLGQRLMKVADDVSDAYLKFAKENLDKVSAFRAKDGGRAVFQSKAMAEESIKRSGYKGAAIVLAVKRNENVIILSPSEAIKRGVWNGDNDKRITLSDEFGTELVEKIGKVARLGAKVSVPWQFESVYDKRKRLAAMNIETPAELRSALREFIGLLEAPKESDKVKQMERAMIGRQNDGLDFFPTTARVADEMIDAADIREGMSVLEPSAGMGHIAERIRAAGVEPDVVELSNARKELLEAKGFNVVGSDFIDTDGSYDRIIMNPPFSDGRAALHVQHAYDMLKPGGRLVAIVDEGVFFRGDKKAQAFRDWLEQVGATDEKLAEGSFMDSSLPVNTGVNARMLVIDKPEGEAKFSRRATPATGVTEQSLRNAFNRKFPQLSKALDRMLQRGESGKKGGVVLASLDNLAQVFADKTGRTLEDAKAALQMSLKAGVAIDKVISAAGTHAKIQERIADVTESEAIEVKEEIGIDIEGYHHTIDNYAVQHSLDRHGKPSETLHGQLPISEEDIRSIPEAIFNPDATVYGAKNKRGQDLIGRIKKLQDGSILLVEEVRTGQKTLAVSSVRKFPATKDAPSIARSLLHNVRNGSEERLSIVEHAKNGQGHQVFNIDIRKSQDGNIQAFYDPQSGLTFMATDNLDPETAANVLLHESVHGNQRDNVDNAAVRLLTVNRGIAGGKLRAYLDEAAERMVAAGAAEWEGGKLNITDAQEAAPYIVEVVAGKAREAGFSAVDGKFMDWVDSISPTIGKFIRSFVASIRAAMLKYGVSLSNVTVDDLVAYAQASMKAAANGDVLTGKRDVVSRSSDKNNQLDGTDNQENTENERVFAELHRENDGSLTNNDGVTLKPAEKTAMGNTRYRITDSSTKGTIGTIILTEVDGKITKLMNVKIDKSKQGAGIGERVLKAVLASSDGDIEIVDIVNGHDGQKDSRGFWKKMGTRWLNYTNDATQMDGLLSWRDYANARLVQEGGRPGTGRTDSPVGEGKRSEREASGFGEGIGGTEAATEGYEVGEVSPEEAAKLKFSRSGKAAPSVHSASWDAPEPTRLDRIVYALQDKNIDLKRVSQAIRDTGKDIADSVNAYLQEELYHGRTATRVKNFVDSELTPLITDMRMRGVEMADFEEYLWMRHAEERNEQIAKVNPDMPDGGSGISTKEANDYLNNLPADKRKSYEALAKRVDKINHETRQTWVKYGIESQDTVDAMESAYQHYVPLMREDMDRAHGNGTGQGFSIKGNSSKRATGSSRAVVDILANMAQAREKAIIRGEKNRVSTALIGLAAMNPNAEFWKIDTPPTVRAVNDRTGLVEDCIDPSYKNRDNVIMARIPDASGNIVEHSVVFNERDERAMRMAQSLKNLDQDQIGEVLGTASAITRYFASINTQYNPIFGVINLTRDVQGAMLNLSSTPLAGKQSAVLGNTVSALRGIYADIRDHRKGKQPSSIWAKLWEEFQKEGGQTGYRDMFKNARERAEALEKGLNPDWWQTTKWGKALTLGGALSAPEKMLADKAVRPLFEWLSDYNETMENSVRLAAYKVAKESGMSNQQAASLAKNLTVNFNRKGEIGRQVGALYAFFNASVQGTARIAETMKGLAGKRILAGGLLLGAMQAMMLVAAGFDDDEPPEFVRDRAIIIPTFGGKYISIPMPLGFNAIPNFGRIMTEFVMSGFKDPQKRFVHIVDMLLDVTNPIGNAGLSMQTIAPTVLDPFAALSENKDWTGKPIARKDFNELNPTPGFTRAKDTASAFSKALSEGINYLTGGTHYKPGAVSPTPDQIDYLIGQITGGVGREYLKAEQTASSVLSGEELPMHKIPLFGRFIGDTTGQSSQGASFYANLRELNEHEAEIKGRRSSGENVAEYYAENPEARLIGMANRIEREVSELRKQKRKLIESDASPDRIKLIEQRITARMKLLNEKVKAMKEAA